MKTRAFSPRSRVVAALAVAFALSSACGGGGNASGAGASSAAAASNGTSAAPSAQATAGAVSGSVGAGKAFNVHVVLTGGPTPSTWDVSGDQACTYLHDPNTGTVWGVEYRNPDLNTKDLAWFSVGYLTGGPTQGFTVQAQVGGTDGPIYVATNLAGGTVGGSGNVTIQDGGTTAKYDIQVKTKDGYSIVGTVQCNKVSRISG